MNLTLNWRKHDRNRGGISPSEGTDWEMARFVELMQVLEGFTDISTKPDTIRWKNDKDGKFSVNRT